VRRTQLVPVCRCARRSSFTTRTTAAFCRGDERHTITEPTMKVRKTSVTTSLWYKLQAR
jgi:hypothetical protein